MAFCSACGTQVPEGSSLCPACRSAAPAAAASVQGTVGGMNENIAGMLAYVTIIPAIVFLVVEPFNKNRFVRFHAFQNIFFVVAWIALWLALGIVVHIPFLGWATILIWPLISLGGLILWVVLVLKAYQGQMFKLPVIGDMAEKQAVLPRNAYEWGRLSLVESPLWCKEHWCARFVLDRTLLRWHLYLLLLFTRKYSGRRNQTVPGRQEGY